LTSPRRDGKHLSGFAEWTRTVRDLDSRDAGVCNTDIDWIWHQYKEPSDNIADSRRVNHVLFIEEKSRGASQSVAQRDTMKQIHQIFFKKLTRRMFRVTNDRGQEIWLKFWGWFTLEYDGSDPQRSNMIRWDGRQITLQELIGILRFDLRPDNLERHDRRICHHRKMQMHLNY